MFHLSGIPPHCATSGDFPGSLDPDPKDLSGSMLGRDVGSEAPVDLAHGDVEFVNQGLGKRLLHHPLESAEPVQVVCQPVVLGYAPKLQLVA